MKLGTQVLTADAMRDEYEARIKALEAELEIERGRLAACGVAALGYFDGCQDEYRSASLEDVLKLRSDFDAERGKRCDWLSEDFTTAATYIPEIDAVCVSQGCQRDSSTVYIGKDEADAILALLTAEQGATDDH